MIKKLPLSAQDVADALCKYSSLEYEEIENKFRYYLHLKESGNGTVELVDNFMDADDTFTADLDVDADNIEDMSDAYIYEEDNTQEFMAVCESIASQVNRRTSLTI